MYKILALWPSAFQYQMPALLFVCVVFVLFLLFVVILSGEPKQFGSLVVLDVVFRYLSLCLLYINTKLGKIDA